MPLSYPGFDKNNLIFLCVLAWIAAGCQSEKKDNFIEMSHVQSKYVDARNIDIWLPPSYYMDEGKNFPVLYMHDGQNLFDTATSTWGITWGVAEWVDKLSVQGKIPEMIIVGIHNTPKRYLEYMPSKPFNSIERKTRSLIVEEYGGQPLGDEYLKFVVEELKPFIDSTYRTKPVQKFTYIMGSSMGGLISSYAITEYPEIFRGAGCLSTHWIGSKNHGGHAVSDAFVDYFSQNLPSPGNNIYYFDYGTETLDARYEPHQLKIDSIMSQAGYTEGKNWITLKFEGAEHNEKSWQQRLDIPLQFLLNNL
jgi:predicted alpha/beta superfamily hydrolase